MEQAIRIWQCNFTIFNIGCFELTAAPSFLSPLLGHTQYPMVDRNMAFKLLLVLCFFEAGFCWMGKPLSRIQHFFYYPYSLQYEQGNRKGHKIFRKSFVSEKRSEFVTASRGVSSVGLSHFVSSVPFPIRCFPFFAPPLAALPVPCPCQGK
jgi:hypothetical protein